MLGGRQGATKQSTAYKAKELRRDSQGAEQLIHTMRVAGSRVGAVETNQGQSAGHHWPTKTVIMPD